MKVNSQIVLGVLAKYVRLHTTYMYYIMTTTHSASWFPIIYVDLEGIEKWITLQKIHAYISSRHKIVDNLISKIFLRIFIYHVDQKNL